MKTTAKTKILRLSPFLVVGVILSVSWFMILTSDLDAGIKQYLGLIIFIVNLLIYFYRFRIGLFVTGLMLLLASFCVISFFSYVSYNQPGIAFDEAKLRLPKIQLPSLFIFILYLILNFNFLSDEYKRLKSKN